MRERDEMKEKFEALVEHLVGNGFFLEEVVELLERTLIERTLGAHRRQPLGRQQTAGHPSQHPETEDDRVQIEHAEAASQTGPRGIAHAPEGRFGVSRIDLLIFDLDGTLIDSRRDLANAGNATRAHMGMPPLDDERVCSYVGNGAPVLVRRSLGDQATEAQIQEGLEYFIEYYGNHKLDYTALYPACGKPRPLADAGHYGRADE